MPPTTIHTAPNVEGFTPLADHQSQTPSTFYNANPVLHYHLKDAKAVSDFDSIEGLPIFSSDAASTGNGDDAPNSISVVIDVFVTSESLTLFNNATSTGISIPYPNISLHAIQTLSEPSNAETPSKGLYMQLELTDPEAFDEEEFPISDLTIFLPNTPSATAESDATTTPAEIQALFNAVSSCSNLHPDPRSQDDDAEMGGLEDRIMFEGNVGYEGISGLPGVMRGVGDGGLPPPFPGSGGWITAENVGEYFDGEGNWLGEGEQGQWIQGDGEGGVLGEGAGRVRGRDEVEAETEADSVNGHKNAVNGDGDHEEDDHKRARVE